MRKGLLRAGGALGRVARGILTAAPLALGALACSSTSPAAPPPSGDGGSAESAVVGCENDPRAQPYMAGMTQMGASGVFQFVLVNADPSPPAQNSNKWTVKVLSGGTPVTGVTFTWGPKSLWMPDHGHGSTVMPMVAANADGTYTISNLYFFMLGLWQITLDATAGSKTDTAMFSFCVE